MSAKPDSGAVGIRPANLMNFLSYAYDPKSLRDVIQPYLSSGVTFSAIHPLRAHLTKDRRLIVAYRLQLFHARSGLLEVPVFWHNTAQSRVPAAKLYRDVQREAAAQGTGIRRLFVRTARDSFVSVFPLDPELRAPLRLLKPAEMLDCWNSELKPPQAPSAIGVNIELLGYRPERRAVLKLRVSTPVDEEIAVVKLYRRQEADRMWQLSESLRQLLPSVFRAALPSGCSCTYSALCFKFWQGDTMHNLLEHGYAKDQDLHDAGKMLRAFHQSLDRSSAVRIKLRTFEFSQEWEILDRWRRFLKHAGSPLAGVVAKYTRILDPKSTNAPQPDALVHRDFYPKQLLVHPWIRHQSLIDFDTVAFGPSAVDVGNFLAHLHLHQKLSPTTLHTMRAAFLSGYGPLDENSLSLLELTSTVRLICLASVAPAVPGLMDRLRSRAHELERQLYA